MIDFRINTYTICPPFNKKKIRYHRSTSVNYYIILNVTVPAKVQIKLRTLFHWSDKIIKSSDYRETNHVRVHISRAVDPHSFFADPDPAVFLNADPDTAAFQMLIRIQLLKKILGRVFLSWKNIKDCTKVRNKGACANLLLHFELTCNY